MSGLLILDNKKQTKNSYFFSSPANFTRYFSINDFKKMTIFQSLSLKKNILEEFFFTFNIREKKTLSYFWKIYGHFLILTAIQYQAILNIGHNVKTCIWAVSKLEPLSR
jgi:hypothetical protein